MRAPVLFALAFAGMIASTADADAFCRRRAAARSEGCHGGGAVAPSYGCYGGGYAAASYGGCYGSAGYGSHSYGGCYGGCYGGGYAYGGGYSYHGSTAYATTGAYSTGYAWTTGRPAVVRGADGTSYTLGANGVYSATPVSNGSTTTTTSGYTPAAAARATTFRAKHVLGTKVLIGNNTSVGTVEDMISDDAGNLEYLVVSTGGNKFVTVPWDAATFDEANKTATLNLTQDVWRAVPTYTATTYPMFSTPAYRADIYKAYGLTPRELRRGR